MTPEQRIAVVAEARSWLRTPYHDHGRVKGAGADCAMLPLDVYATVLGITMPPPPRYVQQWNLHRTEELYLDYVRSVPGIREIAETEVQSGDFVLFHIGRAFAHGAIVVSWPSIVHSVNPQGVMLDDAAQNPWTGRRKRIFFTL